MEKTTNQGLLVLLNELRAENKLEPLKGPWKQSREKLEGLIAEQRAALRPTRPTPRSDKKAKEPKVLGEGEAPRGAINAMCVELLQTDAPYEDIVAAIRARWPLAKTSARSLASVAMDLRAAGLAVPTRRKPAKTE